jgi:hypothetical protein
LRLPDFEQGGRGARRSVDDQPHVRDLLSREFTFPCPVPWTLWTWGHTHDDMAEVAEHPADGIGSGVGGVHTGHAVAKAYEKMLVINDDLYEDARQHGLQSSSDTIGGGPTARRLIRDGRDARHLHRHWHRRCSGGRPEEFAVSANKPLAVGDRVTRIRGGTTSGTVVRVVRHEPYQVVEVSWDFVAPPFDRVTVRAAQLVRLTEASSGRRGRLAVGDRVERPGLSANRLRGTVVRIVETNPQRVAVRWDSEAIPPVITVEASQRLRLISAERQEHQP